MNPQEKQQRRQHSRHHMLLWQLDIFDQSSLPVVLLYPVRLLPSTLPLFLLPILILYVPCAFFPWLLLIYSSCIQHILRDGFAVNLLRMLSFSPYRLLLHSSILLLLFESFRSIQSARYFWKEHP